ncbi:MAG: SRPBCC family protein, partial [Candidatus Edwardsbacteria bacterium]
MTLKDSIEIRATPEKIFDWFRNLDKHFTEWHPNHTKFDKVTGGMDEGDVVYFEECVSGVWYKVKCKITKIEKSKSTWEIEVKSLA